MAKLSETVNSRAREYIDSVIAINKTFGMVGQVSPEMYLEAVTAAEDAVRGLASQD